jgi:hypothetical protein
MEELDDLMLLLLLLLLLTTAAAALQLLCTCLGLGQLRQQRVINLRHSRFSILLDGVLDHCHRGRLDRVASTSVFCCCSGSMMTLALFLVPGSTLMCFSSLTATEADAGVAYFCWIALMPVFMIPRLPVVVCCC